MGPKPRDDSPFVLNCGTTRFKLSGKQAREVLNRYNPVQLEPCDQGHVSPPYTKIIDDFDSPPYRALTPELVIPQVFPSLEASDSEKLSQEEPPLLKPKAKRALNFDKPPSPVTSPEPKRHKRWSPDFFDTPVISLNDLWGSPWDDTDSDNPGSDQD